MLFTSLGALAMAFAPSPWFLFAGRAITGVAAATWVISSILFASYFPPNRSARGIGIISFVNSVAVVAATSVGGQLADAWGTQSVLFGGAALGALGVLFLLPVAEPPRRGRDTTSRDSFIEAVTRPELLMASLISVLVHFAGTASISSFTLVYAARLGATSGDLGLVSALYLGSATVATLGAVYLMERRGYSITILLGAGIMGISLVVTPLVTDMLTFEGLQVIGGAGRGLATTTLMALSIRAAAPAHRATAMGVYQALYAIGMLTGPVLGGFAAEGLGLGSVFYMSGASALAAGGLVLLPGSARR
jgi:predicted MFS family arabinose efflux permease